MVVRSRSLRTSESAPPSPLHASDLLLRTTTFFFYLQLATYLFEYLLRLTTWYDQVDVRVNCTMKQVFALTHISALSRKRFLHLRVLLIVVNRFCLNIFWHFCDAKMLCSLTYVHPVLPLPTSGRWSEAETGTWRPNCNQEHRVVNNQSKTIANKYK